MNTEDIKRACISFKQYCDLYHEAYDERIKSAQKNFNEPLPQIKTDEELYEDFINHVKINI